MKKDILGLDKNYFVHENFDFILEKRILSQQLDLVILFLVKVEIGTIHSAHLGHLESCLSGTINEVIIFVRHKVVKQRRPDEELA